MRSSGSGRFALLSVLLASTCVTAALEIAPSSAVAAAQSDELEVRTEPGGGVRATAKIVFDAKPSAVFTLLTDYAHWPELFEVRMTLADLKVHDGIARTDLRIEHTLLPGERRLVTDSRTVTDRSIMTDLVEGDFKRYHRVWTLNAVDVGTSTLAEFELLVAIDSMVPDWLVALAMRRELESHFRIVKKALGRAGAEK